MTKKELKDFLEKSEIPDDAPVIFSDGIKLYYLTDPKEDELYEDSWEGVGTKNFKSSIKRVKYIKLSSKDSFKMYPVNKAVSEDA